MNITEIFETFGSGASAIGTGLDIAAKLRALLKSRDVPDPEMMALVLDLYDKLIDAKQAQAAGEEALAALHRKIAELEQSGAEFERYSLTETPGGDTIYALKEGSAAGEPPHYICPKCRADSKKAILQPRGTQHHCLTCGGQFQTSPKASGVLTTGRHNIFDGY